MHDSFDLAVRLHPAVRGCISLYSKAPTAEAGARFTCAAFQIP
jgi:hypothetical protein